MTTIYLINNSLTMNNLAFPDKESLEQKREKNNGRRSKDKKNI